MTASRPRVLHVLRADHGEHVGGDLVQLEASVAGLVARGVDAFASTIDNAPNAVDVVHLYNLQRPAALLRDARAARRRWPRASLVVSPVWWPWRFFGMVAAGDRAVAIRAMKQATKQTAWWPLARRVLQSVDLLLPNSQAEVEALRRTYRLRVPPRRWAVIPNGIDLDTWTVPRASTHERGKMLTRHGVTAGSGPVVACVARVEPVKNQMALVRALALLPEASLLLIGPSGDDGYTAAVRSAADASGLRGRVAFVGRLDRAEVAAVLAAVDVHVLPSYRETPGLATLEAAAAGCAVVVTEEGCALEYLGETAHVASPMDAGSIAAAIAAAHGDPRQPAARHRVEQFDWAVAVDRLCEAYGRLSPTTRS